MKRTRTWKDKCDAVSSLRVLAILGMIYGLCIVCVSFGYPGFDFSGLFWLGLPPALTGAAALFARKITAILFSLVGACFGGLLIVLSFLHSPFSFSTILFVSLATLCFLPMVFTIRGWEALT